MILAKRNLSALLDNLEDSKGNETTADVSTHIPADVGALTAQCVWVSERRPEEELVGFTAEFKKAFKMKSKQEQKQLS